MKKLGLILTLLCSTGMLQARATRLDKAMMAIKELELLLPKIHRAAKRGRANKLEMLLKQDPSLVNKRDSFGHAPLHYANSVKVARILLSQGADIDARNNDGVTPLHLTSLKTSLSEVIGLGLCKLLITSGADVNAQDNDGNTPLHDAASFAALRHIDLLLEGGANPSIQNNEGQTPLHLGVGHMTTRLREIPMLLIGGGVVYALASALVLSRSRATIIHIESVTGSIHMPEQRDVVAKDLSRYIDDQRMKLPSTTVPYVAIALGVIAALLATTAITVSVIKRRQVVHKLVRGGANVNATDHAGNTPLHAMSQKRPFKPGARKAFTHIARLLIRLGADVTIQNDDGLMPYDVARKNNRFVLKFWLKPKRAKRLRKYFAL